MNFIKSLILLCFYLASVAIANDAPGMPMSYEDIVTFSRPTWVLLSPSGSKVAFCTRTGVIEKNQNRDKLYLFDNTSRQQEELFQADVILNPLWNKEENGLYFLVKENDKYKILLWNDQGITSLIETHEQISHFTLSPNKTVLYYIVTKFESPEVMQERKDEGYALEFEKNLIFMQSQARMISDEVWSYTFDSKKSSFITEFPYGSWDGSILPLIKNLQISPDNTHLLLWMHQFGHPDLGGTPITSNVLVWDLVNKVKWEPLNHSVSAKEVPHWLNEKQFILQQSSISGHSFWIFNVKTHQGENLDWLDLPTPIEEFYWNNDHSILFAVNSHSFYKIYLKDKKFEKFQFLSSFMKVSLDMDAHFLAHVVESSNEPPEIAIHDFSTQQSTKITCLNPQLAKTTLGKVEKMEFHSNSGPISGYLVHPVNEQPDERYPLIVASYGFQGRFITDAEWHSSFPAQTLAAKGYAVLLLNIPQQAQDVTNDPETARKMEGWDVLELFENAVDGLVERGIADSNKIGIYGWSHGGFVTEFLISHSQKFHVAAIGEGGDYNPSEFCYGDIWQKIFINMFGGPPWGDSLKNYFNFSPYYQIEKIKTPLLMEFSLEPTFGLEMYSPLRYLGVPADMFIYQGEEHNFVKPKARIASMARKVEWFDYWFYGKRNPDPRKNEQYSRWDKMRQDAISKGLFDSSKR